MQVPLDRALCFENILTKEAKYAPSLYCKMYGLW